MQKVINMNDMISKYDVLSALSALRLKIWEEDIPNPSCPEYVELHQKMEKLKDRVDEVSQWILKKEPGWIPVSKSLPEIKDNHVSDTVIVCCDNGNMGFTYLEENIFGQAGWNCERDDDYYSPLGEVVAWMPLPQPYETEEES